MSARRTPSRTASLVTLGCARNEVDSEELAARLEAAGWRIADDGDTPDVVVVNTCGFIESAKQDSIDTLLAAADSGAKVVAAGCLAERYGKQLAEALPEAAAVISFDHYADIGAVLDDVVAGRPVKPHTPRDRRFRIRLPSWRDVDTACSPQSRWSCRSAAGCPPSARTASPTPPTSAPQHSERGGRIPPRSPAW